MRFFIFTIGALVSAAAAQNCTPGSYRCRSPTFPAVCDQSGQWVVLQQCPNGWICIENNGSVNCTPAGT
ncbi:hypothetical protein QBC33DRAFT_411 [Phialemonium atrogriseum]|uniref:Carbohydrate-binding module family 19 domain-containing protein n=1 Tax=Phialemonium atrogriseum TaxID=1093897 RepID=A0AAJ0C8K0_9PEZI|nr:uncharacterized protein QBC33DRAFT_411 [Phialemonium atrogriseum]KAK1772149.1 hypothetical protein QBC33DRAFT_411 [Phialemonium atrogriseum]